MQRERWIVIGVLSLLALLAEVCVLAMPKISLDRGSEAEDRSVLHVSENSSYMRNER